MSLAGAIDRYVMSVEGAGYSPHTLKSYSTRLNDFLSYLGAESQLPVSADDVQRYLASLRQRRVGRRHGVSSSTLAHSYAILSGFFRYCERNLGIEPNPMKDVLKPRGQTSVDDEFKALTPQQLDDLLNVAIDGSAGETPDLRSSNRRREDWLLVAFMGLAGLRVSEVCAIDREDINDDLVTIIGKGRKRRTVPLAPEILDMLEEYIPPQGASHLFGRPTDPMRRIAPYVVEQRIPRLAMMAGIHDLRVTPHVLRHTFGSLMLAADPTALVPTRDLMGHESIETTNKYAHTREEARRLALLSMHEMRKKL